MKPQASRLICLLLSALLVLAAASCSHTERQEEGSGEKAPVGEEIAGLPAEAGPGEETEPEQEETGANLPDKTFGGEEIMGVRQSDQL